MARSLRQRRFIAALALAIVVTALAAAIRLVAAYSTHNAAVMIESFHAWLDVAITLLIVIAMIVARSPRARRMPYGLYKLEDLIAFSLAAALAVGGIQLGIEGFGAAPSRSLIAVYAQGASLPLLAVATYAKKVCGKIVRAPALEADAMHTLGDVLEGSAVLIGIALYSVTSMITVYRAAVAVAMVGLLIASYEAGKDSILSLLDLPREKKLIVEMRRIVEECVPDFEVVEVKARWAGPVVFVEITVRAPPLYVIEDLYRVAERISESIKSRIEYVEDVVVRFEPSIRRRIVVCAPQDEAGLDKPLSKHFGKARFFAIVEIVEGNIVRTEFLTRENLVPSGRDLLIGASVAEELVKRGVTDVVVYRMGELAYSVMLRHRVVVWHVDDVRQPLKAVLEKLVRGELPRLASPTCEAPWTRAR